MKRRQQRTRNVYAKVLRQERKFLPKVVDARKGQYVRVNLDPKDIEEDSEGIEDESETNRKDS